VKAREGIEMERYAGVSPAEEIRACLVAYLSSLLEIPAAEVDVNLPFEQFGLTRRRRWP
jgi:hypothetical protein